MRRIASGLTLLIGLLVLSSTAEQTIAADANSSGYHVIKKLNVGGDGGWDYLTIDPVTQRLYIPRSNRVMVYVVEKEKLVGVVANTLGVHGVALVAKLDRGFASNGGDSTVTVFDLKTLAERTKIKVGTRPDAIIYDPASNQVFTMNASGSATAIDPEKETVAGTIELGGKPEFAVADEKGQIFVNLEDKSEVLAIDAHKRAVIHRWPLEPGKEPAGLAIDRAQNRLFSTCHNQKMISLDAATGKVLGEAAIGRGTDACAFDLEGSLAFSSNGDGTLTVAHEKTDGSLEVVENAETQSGARTMTIDPKTHRVYLVTAKPKQGQRRSYEPGSFVIVVVGKGE
jgi:DNA-binding beta-propeller fold protein YncE